MRTDAMARAWTGRLAAGLLLLALVAGCSSTAKRVPAPYVVELTASADVNPDASGRPSPIQVSLYELASANAFENRDFFALQDDAAAALGAELAGSEQIVLRPGQTHQIARDGDLRARVVGIVAAYRDLEHSRWRLAVDLPEAQNTNIYKVWQFSPGRETIRIRIGRKGLEIMERESSWLPSLF